MSVNYDREKQELTRRNFMSLAANTVAGLGLCRRRAVCLRQVFLAQCFLRAAREVLHRQADQLSRWANQNIADQKVSIIRHGRTSARSRWSASTSAAPLPRPRPATTARATAPNMDAMGNVTHGPAQIALFWFDIS